MRKPSTNRLRGALAAAVALVLAAVLAPVEALAATTTIEVGGTYACTYGQTMTFEFTPDETGVYAFDFGEDEYGDNYSGAVSSVQVVSSDGDEVESLYYTGYSGVGLNYYALEGGQTYTVSIVCEGDFSFEVVQGATTDLSEALEGAVSLDGSVDELYPSLTIVYEFTAPVAGEHTITVEEQMTSFYGYLVGNVYVQAVGEAVQESDVVWVHGAEFSDDSDFSQTGSVSFTVDLEAGQTVFIAIEVASANEATCADVTVTVSPDYDYVWRLYNPYSGEHLFTTDAYEYSVLAGIGWEQEGVAWYAPATGTSVWRLYNPYSGDHHYTTDANEVAVLVALGWENEGEAFCSAGSSGTAVYRLYNSYVTSYYHHYTTDANEYDTLASLGWTKEGTGWYGL